LRIMPTPLTNSVLKGFQHGQPKVTTFYCKCLRNNWRTQLARSLGSDGVIRNQERSDWKMSDKLQFVDWLP